MSKLTVHLVRAAHGNELIAPSVSQGGRRAPAGRCRRVLALPRSWSLAQRQRRKGCFHQLYHLPLHEAEVWPRGFSGARSPRRSSPARLCLPASGARAHPRSERGSSAPAPGGSSAPRGAALAAGASRSGPSLLPCPAHAAASARVVVWTRTQRISLTPFPSSNS